MARYLFASLLNMCRIQLMMIVLEMNSIKNVWILFKVVQMLIVYLATNKKRG